MQAVDADKSSSIVYSIRSGNEKQLLKIDQSSGEILILSPNGLQKSKDDNITLIVIVCIVIYNIQYIILLIITYKLLTGRFFLGSMTLY